MTPAAPRRGASDAAHPFAGLHVLADDDPRWPHDPVAQARAACAGGAAVVQLRAKHGADRERLAWGRAIRALTRQSGARFVVNDRFDLALLCEADAVHLGQDDLPPAAIPATARSRLAVGRSTHDLSQALAARAEGVDYLAFGPVFTTRTKTSDYEERGLDALAEIARALSPLPVVAIGGIDADCIGRVAASGAAGAAVIRAVAMAHDPEAATARLVSHFERGRAWTC